MQEWLAARVSQHVSEDYRWVNPIVHGLLLVLEWALGLGVALLSLLGLGYLAAGLYYACLRGAAEPPPELELPSRTRGTIRTHSQCATLLLQWRGR